MRPHVIAGAALFAIALGVGAARFDRALRPPVATAAGIDLAAARDRDVAALDPTLAFLLHLDPRPHDDATDAALAVAGLPDPLRRALLVETGWDRQALTGALSAEAGAAHDRVAVALGAALDHDDEPVARAAVALACALPALGAAAAAASPGRTLRGRALALSVAACTRPPADAQALLVETLQGEGELATVAALELGRLGRADALPALRSTAAAHPDDLLGLVAAYSADTLSRTAATATQPEPSR